MRIIAVDDDEIALDILQECLEGTDQEYLKLETSPIAALREIQSSKIPYDCILLDVEMPAMDGITLCANIRRLDRYRNTPILMITRKHSKEVIEEAFAKGATDFITKPFEFFEVQSRIRVAELLVRERQAALDSYMAAQNSPLAGPSTRPSNPHMLYAISNEQKFSSNSESMLNLSTFQNYLERIVHTGSVSIDLIALKVRRIHEIFAKSSTEEFLNFLEEVSRTMALHIHESTTFLTHTGNGVFLAAFEHDSNFETDRIRKEILLTMNQLALPKVLCNEVPLDIVVGSPLRLPEASNLNFRRAVKVAIARMEQDEKMLSDTGRLAVMY